MVMINVHRCHEDCHQGQCQLLSTRFVEPALLVLPGSVLLLAVSIQGHFSTPTFIKITPCFLSLPFCPLPFYPTFLPPSLPSLLPFLHPFLHPSSFLPPSPYLSLPSSLCPPLSLSLSLSSHLLLLCILHEGEEATSPPDQFFSVFHFPQLRGQAHQLSGILRRCFVTKLNISWGDWCRRRRRRFLRARRFLI